MNQHTGTPLNRRTMPSPIGTLTVLADEAAIVAIMWDLTANVAGGDVRNPVDHRLASVDIVDRHPGEHGPLDAAITQLGEYFAGERVEFDLPLAPTGTEFQQRAWMTLRTIPYGDTITYGHQAKALGDPNKARAVGAANGQNPIPIVVPCHRVIGSTGRLIGFAGGLDVKAWLLDHERLTLLGVRAARAGNS